MQAKCECSRTATTSLESQRQGSHRCTPSQIPSVSSAYPHNNPPSLVHTKLYSKTTAVRQPTWSSQAWVVDCAASGSSLMACSSCATAALEMVAWKGATGHKEKRELSEHTKSTWSTAVVFVRDHCCASFI